MCIDYDAVGTYAAAPTLTAYGDNTHAAPVAGTQPGALSGSPIVNGHATDTSSTSYLKINEYGDDQTANPAADSIGRSQLVKIWTRKLWLPITGSVLRTWTPAEGPILPQ